MELKNGGADAVLIDNIMAEIYCKQNSDLQYESVPSTAEDTVFCIEKGNTELVQIINDGLAKVKNPGNMMIFIRSILWTHLKTARM